MAQLFQVSEAASLALHAGLLLARAGDAPVPVSELARRLKVSRAHLAKVLQALERAGLVQGTRGPAGGYRLARPANKTTLRQVYEAVAGPLANGRCVFGVPACDGNGCPLGGFTRGLAGRVITKLDRTRLSDVKVRL
ncbi:MAG TPA: Rrf2 family transcriptional regulator [candidate division WOR-3 bacterium]|uniref:Rrf2 family transcriptional regulator n=1 Tax=candidate division WOR-3 bacterium TaxID=2052148 RepID=A0A7V0T6V0_UNCW3|nr:Rrf2 family transcriptional regulator [candidate division WOR-3 bacterium]